MHLTNVANVIPVKFSFFLLPFDFRRFGLSPYSTALDHMHAARSLVRRNGQSTTDSVLLHTAHAASQATHRAHVYVLLCNDLRDQAIIINTDMRCQTPCRVHATERLNTQWTAFSEICWNVGVSPCQSPQTITATGSGVFRGGPPPQSTKIFFQNFLLCCLSTCSVIQERYIRIAPQ